ncbi:MAG TPA: type I restriction-modification system subunit M N-terminal domain-containing protein, partial [Desulfuromonadales bacterium]|nr:type I restriction-modification system subunit M N-terminal domain-containing protein [Desulfuromonadales bacterium]
MTKISQTDVNSAAWAACDTFRGVVDPAQYKDYILVMLFVKYISDVWSDHYEKYRQQYGDDEERTLRKLNRERFVLPKGTSFYDLYEKRSEPNIGELINIALDKIEEANKAKIEEVFRNIDFNSETLGKTKDRNRR